MSEYRRYFVPGGTYFFTVKTWRNRPLFADALARKCLHEAFHSVMEERPFSMVGVVLLPDHLHALWSLPEGDTSYSTRWRRIKRLFTDRFLGQGGKELPVSPSRSRRQERGVWQRRFWEHTIRDEDDFKGHLDYIHYNPVKHGYVSRPVDWPYSSLHKWIRRGIYPEDWGCGPPESLNLPDLTAGE